MSKANVHLWQTGSHPQRGRLKLYLGYAAGVGKTYRMLQELHALQQEGVDVAIAYVETHRRRETEQLLAGLEVIPRQIRQYRGVTLEELDLQATLQRRPQVVVVDEIAHTNAPGSTHQKRYQDVLSLLEAGISVIGALNIQHLESLNDVVARATQITVKETVPDSFLQVADQLVNIDLSVEDLIDRLKNGKIYANDKIEHALTHFFQSESLRCLRELALREVAESLEREPLLTSHAENLPKTGRLMACMSSHSPFAAAMLRRGSRLAGKLSTHWYVVYVETPREAPNRIDAESMRHLYLNINRARELGAEVVQLKSRYLVDTLLHFARERRVGHLLIGRSMRPWPKRWLFGRNDWKILEKAWDMDVHVMSIDKSVK